MKYSFATIWKMDAPINDIWNVIYDVEKWPSWWKSVKKATILKEGDANGLGAILHYEWLGAIPYKLAFDSHITRVEKPHLWEAVTEGNLEGKGIWQLSEQDGATEVRYDWDVSTTKSWMNLLAPIARPIFAWNHQAVMDAGGNGLVRLLGAKMIERAEGE